MLAVTNGATPVSFGQPEHGRLSYGPAGAIVYAPQQGFSGTDRLQVTTTDAVKLYAVDTPPITTVGEVPIQGSGDGSAIAAVPGSPDQIYGLSDRGPNVDGRTDNEKVLPVPDFQPRINRFRLSDGTATVDKTIALTGPDGAPVRGLVDPLANTGEALVTVDGAPLPTSDHGLDTEGLVALADAPSGFPTNTGHTSYISTPTAGSWNGSLRSTARCRMSCRCGHRIRAWRA